MEHENLCAAHCSPHNISLQDFAEVNPLWLQLLLIDAKNQARRDGCEKRMRKELLYESMMTLYT